MRAVLPVLAFAALLGACSQADQDRAHQAAADARAEVKDTAGDIKHDPDVQEAKNAFKGALKDGGRAVKQVAAEAKDATKDAAADVEREGRKAGDETRRAARSKPSDDNG
jgi:uncharacterized membrane-anchored protein YjiN (DUF445 family)